MTAQTAGNDATLSRFNQVFFEECAEHLCEMEQILISLGDAEPDNEQLNAIFRAAHSIKGGAGIFGFEDMTVVTHVMESLLDRIRNREIPFAAAMIDLFLEAGDVISMQLAGHREGKEVSQEAVELVTAKLQQVIQAGVGSCQVPVASTHAPKLQGAPEKSSLRRYRIVFTPDPDMFRRGIRIENIIAELAELARHGEFRCHAEVRELPELELLDPELCSTRWEFTLCSEAPESDIVEVFMFAADEEQLEIVTLPAGSAQDTTLPPAAQLSAAKSSETGEAGAAAAKRGGESDSSIRVNVAKVDQLINQVGELLITQAMLAQVAGMLDPIQHESLQKSVAQLERNTRDLQQSVMSIRLVPISIVFNRFPRMVREIAAKLGKSVELKTSGDSTELDKGLIEKIADPLSHLVRNALDHGLEKTELRIARGKSPTGTLQLKASQVGGRILIEVSDDGSGLDRARILAKASEKGIHCSEGMSDEEVWQLIFAPGFSTAETITDISGRGVGMDVVLKNVQAIGGRVQISSEPGRGAKVSISLPLTLAILEGLSVAVGAEKFIVPLNSIVESLQPKTEQLSSVNGREVVKVRGDYLPIIRLHRLFEVQQAVQSPEQGILVLVDLDEERGALMVDALLDEHQVVVKSIETNYRKVEGTAGATILGDGRVALILELSELITMNKRCK